MSTSTLYSATPVSACEKTAKPLHVACCGGQLTLVMWLEFTSVRTPSAVTASSVQVTGMVSGCASCR
jgi:hypothetical protein